ncbi:HEAT repeat domain-containing protein [Sphingopyxis sp. BE122]|uniref:HEAT repeat domain-containing protein n=2 Tax=unclassified Sphingopyxis TaxID=2614943 RepID=UPI00286AAB1B|nr:HEAT repeat domain-containing protein [Sphingopyxis sp. BE122]
MAPRLSRPTAMPVSASRHDHFPRHDGARRDTIRTAVARVDAAWTAADTAPDGLLTAIAAQADAAPADAMAALRPWLTDRRWLERRLDSALALLRADPFARPPLRAFGGGEGAGGDPAPGGLVLAERGHVRLTLRVWPFASSAPPETPAIFVPGRTAIHVLASGGAQLCQHHVALTPAEEAGAFTASAAAPCQSDPPRPLRTGETLDLDTAREGFTLVPGAHDTLLLELTVQPPSPLPIRSYDPATGHLLHISASRRDSSFRAMALTLLRHLGRPDAVALFEVETHSQDFAARWHAMRELIALNPTAAHAPLAAMAADDPHPEVRAAAQATLALLQSPPLQGRGSETCQLAG